MAGLFRLVMHMLMVSGAGCVAAPLLRRVRTGRGVLVLAYHRIGHAEGCPFDRDVFSATPEDFEAQVRMLKRKFDVISPAELREAIPRGRGRYAMITFDDGYRDNYETAFPILKAHGLTATFFLSTGFLDRPGPAWWDEIAWMIRMSRRRGLARSRWLNRSIFFDEPDRTLAIRVFQGCYKAMPGQQTKAFMEYLAEATGSGRCSADANDFWMTWDMVRRMKAAGMWFGGHTVSHPILARLPRQRQSEEIAGCMRRIREELGEPMRFFAYPRGKPDSFNEDTRQCLREHGVEMAFSFYGGFQRFDGWEPYNVHRTGVERDMGLEEFATVTAMPRLFA